MFVSMLRCRTGKERECRLALGPGAHVVPEGNRMITCELLRPNPQSVRIIIIIIIAFVALHEHQIG